jgi:hypothetical protein
VFTLALNCNRVNDSSLAVCLKPAQPDGESFTLIQFKAQIT